MFQLHSLNIGAFDQSIYAKSSGWKKVVQQADKKINKSVYGYESPHFSYSVFVPAGADAYLRLT